MTAALLTAPLPARAAGSGWTVHGPYGQSITAMAVDPVDTNVVYGEAWNAGIVKSTDAGRTWTPTGIVPNGRDSIAVDAVDHHVVYVTDEFRFWASEDGGATWQVRYHRGFWPSRIAVDPTHEGVLYAFEGPQLQKSMDGGFHWTPVYGDTCGGDVCYAFNQVAVDPMEPQTVMADVGIAGGTGGVIRSRDGGTTWHTVLHGVVWWIEFDPLDPAVVYVVTRRDVLRSTDGGTHWSPLGIRDVHPATIHVDPTDDATLYVTPKWGTAVERSTDGGATWARFADGISGSFPSESVPTTSLLGPLGGAHALLVATQGGVFRSVRGADQWLPRRAGLPALSTRVVAVGSAGALAGTFSPGVVRKRGASWISSNRGIPVDDLHRFLIREITVMAVAPSDGDVVYAEDAFEGLFRSTNGGRSWTRVNRRNFGEGPSIAVDPRDPDHVFMAAFEGVFESTDGGATLQRRTVGLPSVDDVVTSIAFDPHDPMRLYGGGRHGTWASVDGGRHWHRSEDGLDHQWLDPVRVFPDPRHPDTVYVVDSRGVARSTDAGAHWTRLAGSPTDARSMAFDPARPRSLYVGVGRSPGVFLSRDAGATWHPFLGGCRGTDVGSLAIGRGAVANRLYAATSTGVFEAALSG